MSNVISSGGTVKKFAIGFFNTRIWIREQQMGMLRSQLQTRFSRRSHPHPQRQSRQSHQSPQAQIKILLIHVQAYHQYHLLPSAVCSLQLQRLPTIKTGLQCQPQRLLHRYSENLNSKLLPHRKHRLPSQNFKTLSIHQPTAFLQMMGHYLLPSILAGSRMYRRFPSNM